MSDNGKWRGALIAALGAVVGAAIAGGVSWFNSGREVGQGYVELAISILQEDPKAGPNVEGLREWAVDVVNTYSEVKLPDATQRALLIRPLPAIELRLGPAGIRPRG